MLFIFDKISRATFQSGSYIALYLGTDDGSGAVQGARAIISLIMKGGGRRRKIVKQNKIINRFFYVFCVQVVQCTHFDVVTIHIKHFKLQVHT